MDAFAEPERSVGDHIRMAHETLSGERQLAHRVAGLRIEERRSFEDVIRVWTLEVLSGIEGGTRSRL